MTMTLLGCFSSPSPDMLRSTDEGHTWQPWARMTESAWTQRDALYASDGSLLVLGGWQDVPSSRIYRVTLHGMRWTEQFRTNQTLTSLWGSGDGQVYAAGSGGTVLERVGPRDWKLRATGTDRDFYRIWGTAGQIFAVGDEGIHRSEDRGATWRAVFSGEAVRGIWGSSEAGIFAVGANGLIVRSTDGGLTWTRQSSGTERRLGDVWGTGSSLVLVTCWDGSILRSVDQGKSWQQQRTQHETPLTAIWGRDANQLWATGPSGAIVRSGDGGVTWELRHPADDYLRTRIVGQPDGGVLVIGGKRVEIHKHNIN